MIVSKEKHCKKCNTFKPYCLFSNSKRNKDGLQSRCKQCEQEYRIANKEKIAFRKREYAKANKDSISERNRSYRKANASYIASRQKKYNKENKEFIRKSSKKYQDKNKEKIRQRRKDYYNKNKEIINKKHLEYKKKRRQIDPNFDLISRLSRRMNYALTSRGLKKSQLTMQALGCDALYFCQHIERQFIKGMNWDNRSKWHLDHIVPISSAATEEDIYRLSHFTNIRPIWSEDNIAKKDKKTHLI